MDSKITTEFNDTTEKVKLTITIPRKYSPNWTSYEASLQTDSWTQNTPITLSKEFSYASFLDTKTKVNSGDLGLNTVTAYSVDETTLKNAIVSKGLIANQLGNASANDLTLSNINRYGSGGVVSCDVTVGARFTTKDGVTHLNEPITSYDVNFSGFKKTGAMKPGSQGEAKAAFSMRDQDGYNVEVVNEIWQANLFSNDAKHILVPTDQGLAFINRSNGIPEYYVYGSIYGDNKDKMTKYLIQTYYDVASDCFAILYSDSTYNEVNFDWINAEDGSIISHLQVIANLETINPSFKGKAKYFAFTPLLSNPDTYAGSAFNIFPRFKGEGMINNSSNSLAFNVLYVKGTHPRFNKYKAISDSLWSKYEGIPISWGGYTAQTSRKNSFYLLSERYEANPDSSKPNKGAKLVFSTQVSDTPGSFNNVTAKDTISTEINKEGLAYMNYDDCNDRMLRMSPLMNYKYDKNWSIYNEVQTANINSPILWADGSVSLLNNGISDSGLKLSIGPSIYNSDQIYKMTITTNVSNRYEISQGNIVDRTHIEFQKPSNVIDVYDINAGDTYDLWPSVKTYNEINRANIDCLNEPMPTSLNEVRSLSYDAQTNNKTKEYNIEPRIGISTPSSIASLPYPLNGNGATGVNDTWEQRKLTKDTISCKEIYPGKPAPLLDKWEVLTTNSTRNTENIASLINPIIAKISTGELLKRCDSANATNNNGFHKYAYIYEQRPSVDKTSIELGIAFGLVGSFVPSSNLIDKDIQILKISVTDFASFPTKFETTNINLPNDNPLTISVERIKEQIIANNMIANIDSVLVPDDIIISNIKRDLYKGISCNVSIDNNKAYDNSGRRVKLFNLGNIKLTGFEQVNRNFFASNDGINIYGFEKGQNYLWNIDRTAKDNAGDWAYNLTTTWLPVEDAVININILAGYDDIKNKTINDLRGSDFNKLIYQNRDKLYSVLPDDFNINNLMITKGPYDAKLGEISFAINTNRIIKDNVNETITNPDEYVGGIIKLAGFKPFVAQPTIPSEKESEVIFDLTDPKYSNLAISKMPLYFLINKTILIQDLIASNINEFFTNAPSEDDINPATDLNIIINEDDYNLSRGEIFVSGIELLKYYNDAGEIVTTTEGSGITFDFGCVINGFPKLDNGNDIFSKVSIGDTSESSWGFNKNEVTVDEVVADRNKLQKLFSVNGTQKNLVWSKNNVIGANTKQEVIQLFNGCSLYSDTSNTAIDDISSIITEHPDKYHGFDHSYSINTDLYNYTADANKFKITQDDSNSIEGILDVNITVPNTPLDSGYGELIFGDSKAFNIRITGFKTKSTIIPPSNRLETTKAAYEIDDIQLRELIFNSNVIKYTAADFSASDIKISARSDNNINGEISCKVEIINNKAIEAGVAKNMVLNNGSPIVFNGFRQQLALELKNQNVDASSDSGINSIFAIQADERMIKQYVLNHQDQFFINQITTPSFVESDLQINNLNNDTASGKVSFKILVKGNYIQADGSYIKPGTIGTLTNPTSIEVQGFKIGDCTTHIKNNLTELPLSINKLPSITSTQEIEHKLVDDGYIVNLIPSKTLSYDNVHVTKTNSNDVEGSAIIKIIVDSDVAWNNGNPQQVVFENIKVTGFANSSPTSYVSNATPIIGPTSWLEIPSINATSEFIKEYVSSHMNQFFKNTVSDTTDKNIVVHDDIASNLEGGSLTVTIGLNKYLGSDGLVHDDGSEMPTPVKYTFNGFKTSGFTTSVTNPTILTEMQNINASDWSANKTKILQHIISDGVIKNTAKAGIQTTDIDILAPSYNNVTGTLTVDLKIDNSFYWEDAIPKPTKVISGVVLNGFKINQATEVIADASVALEKGSELLNYAANDSVTDDKLRLYVQEHLTEFVHNPIDGVELNNIIIESSSRVNQTDKGTITFTLKLDKYLSKEGQLVLGGDPNKTISSRVSITGFLTDGATTVMTNTNIDSKLSSIDASSAAKNNIEELKQAIIDSGYVKGLQRNKVLQRSHITISTNESLANNVLGTLQAQVTISSEVAWQDSKPKDAIFNVVFTNFKRLTPTQFVDNRNVKVVGELANKYNNGVNVTELELYVLNHITDFVTGMPDTPSGDDLDVEIVPNSANDVSSGTLQINIILFNYMDKETGKLVVGGNWKSPTPFQLSGFKTDAINTTLPSIINLPTIGDKLASDVVDNDPRMKLVLVAVIKENIKGVVDGKLISSLQSNEISFDVVPNSADNTKQQVTINLTIKGGYCKVDGKAKESFTFDNITLTGFKQQMPTNKDSSVTQLMIGSEWNDRYVSSFQDIDAQNFLESKLLTLFKGTAPEDATVIIANNERNINNGSTLITFNLSKHFDDKGIISNSVSTQYQIIIKGFKTNGTTTTLSTTQFYLIGVGDIQASVINSERDNIKVNNAILTQLKANVSNLADGISPNELRVDDFRFSKIRHNNAEGELVIDLTIQNNKAWKDSLKQDVTFKDIKLTGFKASSPTNFVTPSGPIDIGIRKTPHQTTESDIKSYILSHQNKFFINLPPSGITEKDFEITKIDSKDSISITILLRKYIDENGDLQEEAMEPLPGSPEFILSGFIPASGTGFQSNTVVHVTGDLALKPSGIIDDNQLKDFIVANQEKFFTNLPDDGIQAKDLTIIAPSASSGEISFKIKLTKFLDQDTGELATSGSITSPNAFRLVGFYVPGQIKPSHDAKELMLNNHSNFGTSNPRDKFRDDFIYGADKISTEANIKSWIDTNKNVIFVGLPPDATINSVTLNPDHRGTISVDVEIGNVLTETGLLGTQTVSIKIEGFKMTPHGIDLSFDKDGRNIEDKITEYVNAGLTQDVIKQKITDDIMGKINKEINQDLIPEFWKAQLRTITPKKISALIKIQTKDESIISIQFDSSDLVKSPDPTHPIISHQGISWTLSSSSIGFSLGTGSPWIIYVTITSAGLILIILITLLIVYNRKIGKYNCEAFEKIKKKEFDI